MSDETEEIIEEKQAETEEPITPLEVKVMNKVEKVVSDYDSTDDNEYENMYPTEEQVKEYQDEK